MDKDQLLSLGRPQKLCMNCNAPIDAVERHPSMVKSVQHHLERYDYCAACWEHLKDEAFDSFWMTRREKRGGRMPKLNRRQRSVALRALFESLRDRGEEEEDIAPHLFFISHLLMKFGGLKWRENHPDADGREVVVFEDTSSGDRYEIPSVDVGDEQLLAIKAEVEEFLRQFAPDEEIAL